MQLLGSKASPIWDGIGFAGAVTGEGDPGRDELIIGQCCHVCQRSVRWADWLYMRTYHDGFHLFPDEMLFDVEADPHEQIDMASARPEIVAEGAARLARWHAEQMQNMARNAIDVADPLWTVIREGGPAHARHAAPSPLPEYIARLDATGRSDGAAALRSKYARWL
jgi:hypothetical protein